MDTHLVLIRHAETVWNSEGRMQGFQDSPISELGSRQAEALGRRLRSGPFDAVYSSDAARCLRTARIALGNPSANVVALPALRERNLGEWEGRRWRDIAAEDPDGARLYRTSGDYAPPGGETFEALRDRVLAAIRGMMEAHPGRTVLAFTSGGPVRAAVFGLMNFPSDGWAGMSVWNAGLTHLSLRDGAWKLLGANDVGHLAGTSEGSPLF